MRAKPLMQNLKTSSQGLIKKYPKIPFDKLVNSGISKPGRYMGHELGVKDHDWDAAKTKWLLAYPELYELGASNLGHIILYSILNNIPGQLCDRAYLPANDLSELLRSRDLTLFGVESKMPLLAFDIIGFSLSYELGATNILEMLDLANIPILASKRKNLPIGHQGSSPLIFAGGPTATSNPEPFAEFFDFFALGDGEELLPEISLVMSEAKAKNLTRSETLIDLAYIPGVYVPSLFHFDENTKSLQPIIKGISKKVLRRVAKPMAHYGMGLVPNVETIHDRLTIEIRRGCTKGCRFCQPGMLTRPARDVNPKEVINAVEKGIEKTGYSDFSLLSLSCSDYLSLPSVGVELRNKLAKQNITLQLPSQRIDRFDNNIAHILGGSRKPNLTFAPEAGTQRLRDIINKGLTDKDLVNGIRNAMENNFKKVKLYFMIGLPGENNEDVLGIAKTCKMLQDESKDLGRLSLNITISNFTPKPHTPFQWHSVSTKDFIYKQSILRQSFKLLKGIKVNFTDIRISSIEDFIGRGDRNLSQVIETAWRQGAGMDAWFESVERAYTAWTKAISKAGLEGKYRKLEMGQWNEIKKLPKNEILTFCSQALPWDHIDTGIDKQWLIKDFQRALDAQVIPDCSFNSCSSCGVCGEELGHNVVFQPPEIPKRINPQPTFSERLCRIRIRFSKSGPVTLLSHLDIVRILERALRRSQLPVSYSNGFHPLPRIQIALALPLGVEAYSEWMDIDFTESVDPKEITGKLQSCLPKGLKLINTYSIPITKKSLSQELKSAVWSFNLSVNGGSNLQLKEWQNSINYIVKSKELIWKDSDKKGREREKDFKSSLHKLSLEINNKEELNSTIINTIRVKLESNIDNMGRNLKPVQIQEWIQNYLDRPLTISHIKRDELKLFQC